MVVKWEIEIQGDTSSEVVDQAMTSRKPKRLSKTASFNVHLCRNIDKFCRNMSQTTDPLLQRPLYGK
jgi:hypothetical protein